MQHHKTTTGEKVIFVFLVILVLLFLAPIFFVVMNSFKGKLFISDNPFAFPNNVTFSGLDNYIEGVE